MNILLLNKFISLHICGSGMLTCPIRPMEGLMDATQTEQLGLELKLVAGRCNGIGYGIRRGPLERPFPSLPLKYLVGR